jgi:hypothetical protein
MLSEIERIFPHIQKGYNVDIDDIISIRNNRSKLFNPQYFANKFWDIMLLLYGREINSLPINANEIAQTLDINPSSALRYLKVLHADGIICAYDRTTEDCLDIARDNLSLTRPGFENTGAIIQQTRKVFAAKTSI